MTKYGISMSLVVFDLCVCKRQREREKKKSAHANEKDETYETPK